MMGPATSQSLHHHWSSNSWSDLWKVQCKVCFLFRNICSYFFFHLFILKKNKTYEATETCWISVVSADYSQLGDQNIRAVVLAHRGLFNLGVICICEVIDGPTSQLPNSRPKVGTHLRCDCPKSSPHAQQCCFPGEFFSVPLPLPSTANSEGT